MKKGIIVMLFVVIVMIAGCGSEPAAVPEATTQAQEETWSPWTFNDISFEMPDSWEYGEDNSTEKICYFYPDDGMFMIIISEAFEIDDDSLKEYAEGLGEADNITVTKSELYSFRGEPAMHIFADFENDNGLHKGEIIATNISGSLYAFVIESDEEGKYKDEFYKILNSVSEISVKEPEEGITEYSEEETEEPEPEVTIGEQNALDKALSYLEFMAFSKKGLKKQLEYEGFEKSEIKYAIKHCGADWKEQAVKKAEEYLNSQSFSKQGLYDQLIYEGFTEEQAEYGVEKAYK